MYLLKDLLMLSLGLLTHTRLLMLSLYLLSTINTYTSVDALSTSTEHIQHIPFC